MLANGSISGVNLSRFEPNPELRLKVRRNYNIPDNVLVFLFMSRLTRDKGALVMAEAFSAFCIEEQSAHLFVVGPDEENLRPRIREICQKCIDRVHFVDYTNLPGEYMSSADVFCLPSYREGFGTATINASAVGIPAIASRIYGSVDAIDEGVTGLLHEAGNISELVRKNEAGLGFDPDLRSRMGENGRLRVQNCFSEEMVTKALLEFYNKHFKQIDDDKASCRQANSGPVIKANECE